MTTNGWHNRVRKNLFPKSSKPDANHSGAISEIVWLEPSVSDLVNYANGEAAKTKIIESENSFALEAENQNAAIVKISLVVSKNDYRAIGQTVWAENAGKRREFRFTEAKYERPSIAEIPNGIFDSDIRWFKDLVFYLLIQIRF